MKSLLYLIAVILALNWLLGGVSFHFDNTVINIVLGVVVILVIFVMFTGRK